MFDANSAEPASEQVLRTMLAMIRHRGPDQAGIYIGPGIGLGSARLSIVDLEGGQQPISNEDQTLWIVFNGEIFNHVELRTELEARGHRFTTKTDTEVILHLFEESGPNCLSRLNGQFAIAIWNETNRTLFLGRDRVGVRPLFYSQSRKGLAFGSEIKALLACPGVAAELDPLALKQIFTYWSTLSPATCFRGIHSLPPGHYLIATDGDVTIRDYWSLRFDEISGSEEECAERLEALLLDAVRIRLRADVPVGAYLSGGLDSSLIASMVRRLGVSHLDTFSIAFSDPNYDESAFQRRMAAHLGTDHQVVQATHEDIGRVFPDVIWHAETPVLRTAPAPMFLLSRLVNSRKYKVVLTGEGADEFLAGYDIFKETLVRRFWARSPESRRRPLLLRKLYPDIGTLSSTGTAFLRAFFAHQLTEVNRTDYSHTIRWRNTRRACRFFSQDLQKQIAHERQDKDPLPVPTELDSWSPLARAQYWEITIFLTQYLLASQGDRMGMAHSVEGRFPFLDHRVIEFCNALPARLKMRGLTEKVLLRRIARAWLPDEILNRVKKPYRAPIQKCFFGKTSPDYVRDLLSSESISATGYFDASRVAQLVDKLKNGQGVGETDEMALAGILSTQLVHRQFVSNFKPVDRPFENGTKVVRLCSPLMK